MFVIEDDIEEETDETQSKLPQSKAGIPQTAVGNCANRNCGILLFPEPEAVPDGWIIVWHINCGGYCPECLLALSAETLTLWGIDPAAREKAQHILDTIPEYASNKVQVAYEQP